MAVPVAADPVKKSFNAGIARALFQTRIELGAGNWARPQYDVSHDGRFLVNTVLDAAASPITLLINWKPPVKLACLEQFLSSFRLTVARILHLDPIR